MDQDNKYEVSMQLHLRLYIHRKKKPGGVIERNNKVDNNSGIMIFQEKNNAS